MPKNRALGGSRQDLSWEGAPSLFINCRYCVDFLMERLYVTDNLLQKNLFVILQSVAITTVLRFHEIMHIDIGLPIRYLTAKTHELGKYNWGVL